MKKFSKDFIDDLIKLSSAGDNNSCDPWAGQFCRNALLEAKVQVDRHNCVITDWIFHTSKQNLIQSLCEKGKTTTSNSNHLVKSILETLSNATGELKEAAEILNKYKELLDRDEAEAQEQLSIWGAHIHFTDNLPPDIGIGVAMDDKRLDFKLMENDTGNPANSIVVFNVSE